MKVDIEIKIRNIDLTLGKNTVRYISTETINTVMIVISEILEKLYNLHIVGMNKGICAIFLVYKQ